MEDGSDDYVHEVLEAAYQISGDRTVAMAWYRGVALHLFGGKTAEQLVSDGQANQVLRYLNALHAGASGQIARQ